MPRQHAKELWASDCQRCLGTPNDSPVCARCSFPVAPEHYVIEVKQRHRSRQELFEYPFYPSGHPATGPTYWEQAVRTIDESDYEISYADGGRTFDRSIHVAKQCDHCYLRGEEEMRRKQALEVHRGSTPHPYVQKPSYDEAWRIAWLCVGSAFIPLGIFALAAKSIWVLIMGEVVVFIAAFGVNYAKQTELSELQARTRDKLLEAHREKEEGLEVALDELGQPRRRLPTR
jgi:hypothetical protein